MNTAKKFIIPLCFLILGSLIPFGYGQYVQNKQEDLNAKNIDQLQIGTPLRSVIDLMGQPSRVATEGTNLKLLYKSNERHYTLIYIIFDSNLKVEYVFFLPGIFRE